MEHQPQSKIILTEIGRMILGLVVFTLGLVIAIGLFSGSLWSLIFLGPIYLLIVTSYLYEMIHGLYKLLVQNRKEFIQKHYPHVSVYVNEQVLKDCKEFLRIPDTEWASREEKALHNEEKRKRREEQIEIEYHDLEGIASHGIEEWLKKNDLKASWSEENRDEYNKYIQGLFFTHHHIPFGKNLEPQWTNKQTIIDHRGEIIQLESIYQRRQRDTSWFSTQELFSKDILTLCKEKFSFLGRYVYPVPVGLVDEEGNASDSSQSIWQLFFHGYCTNVDLDYSLLPSRVKLLNYLLNNQSTTDWKPYDRGWYLYIILNILRVLREKYGDLEVVIYNDELIKLFFDEPLNGVQTSQLRNQDKLFAEIMISLSAPLEKEQIRAHYYSEIRQDLSVLQNKKLFVITNQTATSEIISFSRQLWDRYSESRPCISCLSLFKEYSTEEMQRLIEKKKQSIAEEEKRRKEQKTPPINDINPTKEVVIHKEKEEGASECEVIVSKPNPKQVDDLRIRYTPSDAFNSSDIYPIVYSPVPNSLLKLPRLGRSDIRGFKEPEFLAELQATLTGISISDNFHLRIPGRYAPYEPDIVLYDEDINLYIDVEIDEPYDGYNRLVTHIIEGSDVTRDIFFKESGWIVVRFSEKQIHFSSRECIRLLENIIAMMRGEALPISTLIEKEPRWDRKQAREWEKELYREKYLGIQFFPKQDRSRKIMCLDKPEGIDLMIKRTPVHKPAQLEEQPHFKQSEKEGPLPLTQLKKLLVTEPAKEAALEARKPTELRFDEHSHSYYDPSDTTGNSDRISVTTLIDSFFPHFDEEAYINKRMNETGMSEDEIRKELEEPAERGTNMHKQIENYLKGLPYDGSSKEFQFFLRFHEEQIVRRGLTFDSAEYPIELKDSNIAGTVDALFRKSDGDYVMVDWKRSKHLIIDGYPKKYGFGCGLSVLSHLDNSSYYKYELQQSFYRYILEKDYGIRVSSMILAVFHPEYDNYYTVKLSQYRKQEVLDMIESYESTL